jgi:hypothetical protein
MKTKPLTFLLSLIFLFVFSGSVFGQEEVKNEYGENKKLKSEIHFKNEKKDTLKTTSNDGGQKLFRGDLAGAWEYLLGFAAFVIAIQLLVWFVRYIGIAMIAICILGGIGMILSWIWKFFTGEKLLTSIQSIF